MPEERDRRDDPEHEPAEAGRTDQPEEEGGESGERAGGSSEEESRETERAGRA